VNITDELGEGRDRAKSGRYSGLDEKRNNAVITTRRNNCGIECTSDLARGRHPIIIAADISHRADPAATAAAAIWHLHGVNWYLERYYAIMIRARARVCVCT